MQKLIFSRRILNILAIVSVNITILFTFLILFEISLRLFWRMSTLQGEFYITSKDHTLRYELKPGISIGGITTNSDGFRDKEYTIEKPKNYFRIIVLGDSETFSKKLTLEDSMPKKLQYELNRKCKDHPFEVFNMGVEGYNTIQELEFLKYKGLKYKPDLVILYYSFNDPDYPEYYFKKNFLSRNFLLAKYIQYRIKKALVKRDRRLKHVNSEEGNFKYLYTYESWDYTKEAILNIAELARKNNFKFAVVIILETSSAVLNFREGYPYWYINEKLSAFLNSHNIAIIDPVHLFKEKNLDPLELVISQQDRHKNAKANSIIASYLSDELINSGLIPCGSSSHK